MCHVSCGIIYYTSHTSNGRLFSYDLGLERNPPIAPSCAELKNLASVEESRSTGVRQRTRIIYYNPNTNHYSLLIVTLWY